MMTMLMTAAAVVVVAVVVSLRRKSRSISFLLHGRAVPIHHFHRNISRNSGLIIGRSVFISNRQRQHHPCCPSPLALPPTSSSSSNSSNSIGSVDDDGRTGEIDIRVIVIVGTFAANAVVVIVNSRLGITWGLAHPPPCSQRPMKMLALLLLLMLLLALLSSDSHPCTTPQPYHLWLLMMLMMLVFLMLLSLLLLLLSHQASLWFTHN